MYEIRLMKASVGILFLEVLEAFYYTSFLNIYSYLLLCNKS